MERIRTHFFITGRVQGVAYRASALHVAVELGLSGWVRNCSDGRVEIIAEGNTDKLTAFTAWLKQGPSYAIVEHVSAEQAPASGEFDDFIIIN